MRAIETEYKGYRFRSRLEARWALFFDLCRVEWEYEPEGFVLDNGDYYLPDFLLHDVRAYHDCGMDVLNDLWVEVKGKMAEKDEEKLLSFCGLCIENGFQSVKTPVYIVAGIPEGNNVKDFDDFCDAHMNGDAIPFNFMTVDGDDFPAYPGIDNEGKFGLFGADSSYTLSRNGEATERAFRIARQARFEHGEKPVFWRNRHMAVPEYLRLLLA